MDLETELKRLSHLAGHARALGDWAAQISLTAYAIEDAATEGDELMTVASALKDLSGQVATAAANVRAAIEAAIARLADNPTATDLAEVSANLTTALGELTPAETAAGGIDPGAPGGVVTDPADPGDVIEEPV